MRKADDPSLLRRPGNHRGRAQDTSASCKSAASASAPSFTKRPRSFIGRGRHRPARHGRRPGGIATRRSGAFNVTVPPDASPETMRLAALPRPLRQRSLSTPSISSNGASGRSTAAAWPAICFVHLFSGMHFVTGAIGPTRADRDGRDSLLEGWPRRTRCAARPLRLSRGLQSELARQFRQGAPESERPVLVGSEGVCTSAETVALWFAPPKRAAASYDRQLLARHPAAISGRVSPEVSAKPDPDHR